MKFIISSVLSSFLMFLIWGCGATSTVRYDSEKEEQKPDVKESSIKEETTLNEDFDITPYKTKIELPEVKSPETVNTGDVWYEYDSPKTDKLNSNEVSYKTSGFRVQVIAIDDMDEANRIIEEISDVAGNNKTYMNFEPPFYKVLLGDFETSKEADQFRFKLNQLGYREAKVVKDEINIFK